MSIFTEPKVRIESAGLASSPIEARLMHDGSIRLQTDPDSMHLHTAWLTVADAREFATELLGLADASETIHGDAL